MLQLRYGGIWHSKKVVSYVLCFVCWEYMCLVVKCEQKEVLFYAGTRPHATPFTYNSVFIPLRSSHSACTVAHDYLCIRYNKDIRSLFFACYVVLRLLYTLQFGHIWFSLLVVSKMEFTLRNLDSMYTFIRSAQNLNTLHQSYQMVTYSKTSLPPHHCRDRQSLNFEPSANHLCTGSHTTLKQYC